MSGIARAAITRAAWIFLCVFLCVAFFAYLGIASRLSGVLASFWPANAVLAGIMVRWPHLRTPPGWLGAAAGYCLADVSTGTSVPATILLTAANLTGVLVVVSLLSARSLDDQRVRRPAAVLAVLATAVAGALGGTVLGTVAGVKFFGMSVLTAAQFWFTVEVAAYASCLIVVLSMPSPAEVWARVRGTMALSGRLKLRRIIVSAAPALAVAAAVGLALVIGGPAAIAFTVPVLAAVALRSTVFETALLALLAQSSLEVAIRANIVDVGFDVGTFGSAAEASVRVGLSLISIGPVMVAASTDQRRSRHRELQNQVGRDGLIGALARDPLLALGDEAFDGAVRTHGKFAILLIDVDGFKQINDRYGYPAGDAVLAETARRCRAGLRDNDQFGRVGDDEFCAVVAGATSGTCGALGGQLRTLVHATPMHVGTEEIVVTISVGVAHWQAGDESGSFAEVYRRADDALHAAKRAGPNHSVL